jgi:hypothetical protein
MEKDTAGILERRGECFRKIMNSNRCQKPDLQLFNVGMIDLFTYIKNSTHTIDTVIKT